MRNPKAGRIVSLLVAGIFIFSGVLAFAQEEKLPWDGMVELTSGSIAAGIGFSWGGGTLKFQGKEYPFKIDGLSVGSVGISKASAWGKVYHLKKVEDFAGTYAAIDAGMTIVGGAAAGAMKNEKGVILDLFSTTEGLKFTLGTSGAKIQLK